MAGWHGHIVALLFATGVFSTLVALVAYSYGRERRLIDLVREDGDARHHLHALSRSAFVRGHSYRPRAPRALKRLRSRRAVPRYGHANLPYGVLRSEERRVGKEWRARWERSHKT